MSQLIQMRRRIKAIETIKKITSAMRLISRSFHTRMHKRQDALGEYHDALCNIFAELRAVHPEWQPARFFPSKKLQKKELIIIIGSQKGLCGNFNTNLFYWIDNHRQELAAPNQHIIVMGKRVDEHLQKRTIATVKSYAELKPKALDEVTENLLHYMFEEGHNYTKVSILYNKSKTFFSHEQKLEQVIPFIGYSGQASEQLSDDYRWEHSSNVVLNMLAQDFLKVTVRTALFDSLLGEQAARFISMDNATRNANKFLDSMQLQYNKARQAKITKELTELAGAFESDSFT
jgi:F-type H+-transporting ATPase subunit gamma